MERVTTGRFGMEHNRTPLGEALDRCRSALESPELRALARTLERVGMTEAELVAAAAAAHEFGSPGLERIRSTLEGTGAPTDDGALERLVLMRAAAAYLPQAESLPLGPEVKALYVPTLEFLSTPGEAERGGLVYRIGHANFASMCKVVTLRRFPAGQWDWEVSGVLRSWFLRIGPRHLPGLALFVMRELGGLRPLFTPHFTVCRKHRIILRESDVHESYRLMADAMARQSDVLGFVEHSWLVSDDVHRVSPHLAWMNRVFRENGGYIAPLGIADEGSGVFEGVGARRRQLLADARIKPKLGLVLWPRRHILGWAHRAA
jgi:hypothetical protein